MYSASSSSSGRSQWASTRLSNGRNSRGPRALPCRWWMRPQGQDPQLLILDNDSACQARHQGHKDGEWMLCFLGHSITIYEMGRWIHIHICIFSFVFPCCAIPRPSARWPLTWQWPGGRGHTRLGPQGCRAACRPAGAA